MRRSLFVNLFIRLALAAAVVLLIGEAAPTLAGALAMSAGAGLGGADGALDGARVAGGSGTSADGGEAAGELDGGRSGHRGAAGRVATQFRDFDGLAGALASASMQVKGSLSKAGESRRQLEALLDSMQDAVVAVDAAGRIQWTNERMQRMMARRRDMVRARCGWGMRWCRRSATRRCWRALGSRWKNAGST